MKINSCIIDTAKYPSVTLEIFKEEGDPTVDLRCIIGTIHGDQFYVTGMISGEEPNTEVLSCIVIVSGNEKIQVENVMPGTSCTIVSKVVGEFSNPLN